MRKVSLPKRIMALILCFSMVCSMSTGAFAQKADCTCDPSPAVGEAHQDTCPLYVAPETVPECTCEPVPGEGEAHQDTCPLYVAPEAVPECTCEPVPGEGEAHEDTCPLYVAPEAVPECTCDPVPGEGEAHQDICPLYVAPEVTPQVVTESGPKGGPLAMNVGTLAMNVTNAGGVAVDLDNLVLTDLESGQVSLSIPIQQNTTTDTTIEVGIPDFYSFANVSATAANYTSAVLSTDTTDNTHAVDNRLTIVIPAPSDGKQKTIALSFDIKLNRTTIDATDEAAWVAGTWTPNDDNCDFTMQESGNASSLITETATIVTKPFITDFYASYSHGTTQLYLGSDGKYISIVDEHGCPGRNPFPSYQPNALTLIWPAYDIYNTGVSKVQSITVTAPAGFQFVELPENNIAFSGYKNMTSSTTCVLSGTDNTVATLTIHDDDTSVLPRLIPKLRIKPLDNYLQNENQTPSTLFPANSEHPVTAVFDVDGMADITKTVTLKVRDYQLANSGNVAAGGVLDLQTSRPITAQVESGSTTDVGISATVSRTTDGSTTPVSVPPDDGAGYTMETVFDDDLEVHSFTVRNDSAVNNLTPYHVSGVKYYTDANTAGTDVTVPANNYFKVTAPAGEKITKIVLTYDKLAYFGGQPMYNGMNITVPSDPARTMYPITHTLKDAGGTEVDSGTHYIMIRDLLCPTFVIGSEAGNQVSQYATPGTYSQGDVQPSLRVGIENVFLGGTSGVLDKLENPILKMNFGYHRLDAYVSNGVFTLHKVMGGGNWTLTVAVAEAEAIKSGAGPRTVTFTTPAFTTDTKDIDLYDSAQFANALSEGDMIYSYEFSYTGMLDISSMSGAGADKTFFNVQIDELTVCPANGYYFGEPQSAGYGASSTQANNFCPVYDNCTDIDHRHAPDVASASSIEYLSNSLKGAEILAPNAINTSNSGSVLTQGKTSTLNMGLSLRATAAPSTKFVVQPGWTAYLKLADQPYANFVPGTGSIEGVVDPNSTIVTINGAKYIKITYTGAPVGKAGTLHGMDVYNQPIYDYEAIGIGFDISTMVITPTDSPLQVIENSGSWLDIAPADVYTYGDGGNTYRVSIQPGGVYFVNPTSWFFGNTTFYDDPLGFYTETAANDRNWALAIGGLALVPLKDAVQGITINPGINESYQPAIQAVPGNDEGSMTTGISVIAGTTDMHGLVT